MRWPLIGGGVLVLALTGFLIAAGCRAKAAGSAVTTPTEPTDYAFDADRAWQDLVKQVDFGPRVPGTAAHKKTRDWLVKSLDPTSKAVTLQPFSHKLGGADVQMWNIIADYPGTGPAPRERVILVAHWDTRPTADYDPDPFKRLTPIPGASDGASGVAVLLEIARQLKAHPIARDVTILLVDGEDYGPKVDNMLLGAKYYVAHLPKVKPTWGILLDMVGDKNLDIYREPNSDQYAKAVNDRIFRAAKKLGYMLTPETSGFVDAPYKYAIDDDHMPFNEAGVPMADLIDFDYPVWHTTADDVAHCDAYSLKLVGAAVLYGIQLP